MADASEPLVATPEMVEKVAAALYQHEARQLAGNSAPGWERTDERTRKFFRASATVAVNTVLAVLHEQGS